MRFKLILFTFFLSGVNLFHTSSLSNELDSHRSSIATTNALSGFENAKTKLSGSGLPSAQRVYGYDYSKFSVNDETIQFFLNGNYPIDLVPVQFLSKRFQSNKSNSLIVDFSSFISILRKGDGIALSDGFTNHVTMFSHMDANLGRYYFLDQEPEYFFLLEGRNAAGVSAKVESDEENTVSISHEELDRVWRGGTLMMSFEDLVKFSKNPDNYQQVIELSSRGRSRDFLNYVKAEFDRIGTEDIDAKTYASFFVAFNRIGIDGIRYRKLTNDDRNFIRKVISLLGTKFENNEVEKFITYDFYLELCELYRYEMPHDIHEFILPLSEEMLRRDPKDPLAKVYYLAALVRSGQSPTKQFFEDTLQSMREVFTVIDKKGRKSPISELLPARNSSATLRRLYSTLFFTYELYIENQVSENDWPTVEKVAHSMLKDFPNQWKPRAFLTIALGEQRKCQSAGKSFAVFGEAFKDSSNDDSPLFPYWNAQKNLIEKCT